MAPRNWSKMQCQLRLVELEGESIMESQPKEVSPLRKMEIEINKAARRKSDLQSFMTETLGMRISGQEDINQLKLKALNHAYLTTMGLFAVDNVENVKSTETHPGRSSGLHGVRPVLPPVVPGSDGGTPGVCDLGSRSGQGRSGLSQVGPLPEVDREESYATTGRDSKAAEVPEQTKVIEQPQPIGTDPDSEGVGSECAEDVFRDQGPQGRPTRTSEGEQRVLKGNMTEPSES